jgi:WD40 repeat protein
VSAVARLLQDTVRVLQEYRVPLRSHALHAYHSAFVTMPQCLLLEALQRESVPSSLPSLTSARTPSWGSWNRVMEGHKDEVRCVAVSSDGQRIVSGSKDGTVRVWSPVTLKELAKLTPDDKGYVTSIAFSPDGTRFVTISVSGVVHVWDSATLRQLVQLEINRELISRHTWPGVHPRGFCSMFSSDGTRIFAAAAGDVCVWSAITFEELGAFKAHAPLALSPDNARIVAFRSRKMTEAAVYDATTFEELVQLKAFATDVGSIAFSPDGHHVVFGLSDNTVRVWSGVTWEETARLEFQAYIGGVNSVAFSPCGSRIVSASADRTLRLWDATSYKELARFKGHEEPVHAVVFSPDGTQLLSGSEDNTVRLWSTVDFEDPLSLEDDRARQKWSTNVVFLPGGDRIMTRLGDEPLRIWEAETLNQLGQLQHEAHAGDARLIVWSSDGSFVTTRHGGRNSLLVWNTKTFQTAAELQRGLDAETSFVCAAFSPDNKRIVSGMDNGAVLVWDALSSEVLSEYNEASSCIWCVAYSPDGSHIAAGSEITLRVWDAGTCQELYVYHSSIGAATRLEFSHNGARLIAFFSTKERKNTVCIVWSVDTFQVLAQFESDFSRPPAFTANGRGVLFEERDGTTSAWMHSQADNSTCKFPIAAHFLSITPLL